MAKPQPSDEEEKHGGGRQGRMDAAPMATDADHAAQAWPCRHKASSGMAERAAATEKRGREFAALARVVSAASGGRPTTGKTAPQPHGPFGVGQIIGLCANIATTCSRRRS